MSNYPRNQWPYSTQNVHPDTPQEHPDIDDLYRLDHDNSLTSLWPHSFPSIVSDAPATTRELLPGDGSGQLYGHHPPEAIGFLWDAAVQIDEGYNPGVSSSDMNPGLFYHQGTPMGMPTSNQYQGTAISLIEIPLEAQNLPMGNSSGPTIPSAQLPQPAVQPLPHGQKYKCGICPKSFDRPTRVENCRNRHSGAKPHQCRGRCGTSGCSARYSSAEYLRRHIHPLNSCPSCGKNLSRQNMPRHRASCRGPQ